MSNVIEDRGATMTVEQAAVELGISRALAYRAVHAGEIPSINIGRRILVPRRSLERLLSGADAVAVREDA